MMSMGILVIEAKKNGAGSDWITFCVQKGDEQQGSLTRVINFFFKYFKKNIYKINLKCIFVLEYDHTPLIYISSSSLVE
jgi:hypothetical protein